MILPLLESEQTWPTELRGALYAAAMLYCFLGVALIADIFMTAIEAITSRRKLVRLANGRTSAVKAWNETVATLTLMALGSSAPEICLSTIDLFKKDFHVGELGPSTIVGSAAFNLLVIVAVCIMAIPANEVRRIVALPAFYVTAVFSLGAYMWLVFILTMNTVDVVDIWEAAFTLLMGPLFVFVAYRTDQGSLCRFWPANLLLRVGSREALESPEGSLSDEATFFAAERLMICRQPEETQKLEVVVLRSGDCDVAATSSYHTECLSAVPGFDYEETFGSLCFAPGQREAMISLEILPSRKRRHPRELIVVLQEEEGSGDEVILPVTLEDVDPVRRASLSGCLDAFVSLDGLQRGLGDWRRQAGEVLYSNGSREEHALAHRSDLFLHFLGLPWKLLFVVVPPTSFLGGWFCFSVSLAVIAFLTALLGDLAELFGCVLDVADIVTAVSFVALGTSMPDLFASLSAAKDDETADAAVVNVTGSNAVNVFLGLGLPWTIGSVYWRLTGRNGDWEARYQEVASRLAADSAAFVVDSRNLGFQVLLLLLASVVALGLLSLRRFALGAELGGPTGPKRATAVAFVAMWIGFIGMCSWRTLRWSSASPEESWATMCSAAAVLSLIVFWPLTSILRHTLPGRPHGQDKGACGDHASPPPPAADAAADADPCGHATAAEPGSAVSKAAAQQPQQHKQQASKVLDRSVSIGSLGSVGSMLSVGSGEALALEVKRTFSGALGHTASLCEGPPPSSPASVPASRGGLRAALPASPAGAPAAGSSSGSAVVAGRAPGSGGDTGGVVRSLGRKLQRANSSASTGAVSAASTLPSVSDEAPAHAVSGPSPAAEGSGLGAGAILRALRKKVTAS